MSFIDPFMNYLLSEWNLCKTVKSLFPKTVKNTCIFVNLLCNYEFTKINQQMIVSFFENTNHINGSYIFYNIWKQIQVSFKIYNNKIRLLFGLNHQDLI